jgi:hypothetical protein
VPKTRNKISPTPIIVEISGSHGGVYEDEKAFWDIA